jgi:hypothetical protein
MPNPSKDLEYQTRLRTTLDEREILQQEYVRAAAAGLTVSLNDVTRHLIRRAAIRVPCTEPDARAVIMTHWRVCPDCTETSGPQCLDGLYLRGIWERVRSAEQQGRLVT